MRYFPAAMLLLLTTNVYAADVTTTGTVPPATAQPTSPQPEGSGTHQLFRITPNNPVVTLPPPGDPKNDPIIVIGDHNPHFITTPPKGWSPEQLAFYNKMQEMKKKERERVGYCDYYPTIHGVIVASPENPPTCSPTPPASASKAPPSKASQATTGFVSYNNLLPVQIPSINDLAKPEELTVDNTRVILASSLQAQCRVSQCSLLGGYMAENPLSGAVVVRLAPDAPAKLIPTPTQTGPVRITKVNSTTGIVTLESQAGSFPPKDTQGNPVQENGIPEMVKTPGKATYYFDINNAKFNP